jgi:hypothetical protein
VTAIRTTATTAVIPTRKQIRTDAAAHGIITSANHRALKPGLEVSAGEAATSVCGTGMKRGTAMIGKSAVPPGSPTCPALPLKRLREIAIKSYTVRREKPPFSPLKLHEFELTVHEADDVHETHATPALLLVVAHAAAALLLQPDAGSRC